jgi:hypothetical protein
MALITFETHVDTFVGSKYNSQGSSHDERKRTI